MNKILWCFLFFSVFCYGEESTEKYSVFEKAFFENIHKSELTEEEKREINACYAKLRQKEKITLGELLKSYEEHALNSKIGEKRDREEILLSIEILRYLQMQQWQYDKLKHFFRSCPFDILASIQSIQNAFKLIEFSDLKEEYHFNETFLKRQLEEVKRYVAVELPSLVIVKFHLAKIKAVGEILEGIDRERYQREMKGKIKLLVEDLVVENDLFLVSYLEWFSDERKNDDKPLIMREELQNVVLDEEKRKAILSFDKDRLKILIQKLNDFGLKKGKGASDE